MTIGVDLQLLQVPPPDNIERVPLGASSASMYPGYSPADHIYGEAAQEYGQRIAAARKKGLEIKQDADGLDYVVGQSSLSAKEQIEEIRRAREEAQKQKATATPLQSENAGKDGQDEEDQATLFTIDSNPTPLSQLNTKLNSKSKDKARDKAKRHHTASFSDEPNTSLSNTEPQTKKVKVSASEPLGNDANANEEFEKAVADRKARKEEKRKRKEEKKRKRESNSSQMAPPPEDGSREVDVPAQSPMPERPKKKKHKKDHEPAIETNASEPGVKQQKTDRDAISDTSGLQPKEKHKKEKKRTKDEADEVPVGGNADKKKKKHKDHAG